MKPKDRLAGLRGKAYYAEFAAIWRELKPMVVEDFRQWRDAFERVSFVMLGALAYKHGLPLKTMWEQLERDGLIYTGTYDDFVDRGGKARALLADGAKWLADKGE